MADYVYMPPREVTRECALCGKKFSYLKSGPGNFRTYCSRRCYLDRLPHSPKIKRDCLVCGKGFITAHDGRKYCSGACRENLKNERRCANRKPRNPIFGIPPVKCKNCHQEFHVYSRNENTFCSRSCSFAFKARHKKSKEEIKQRQLARLAEKRSLRDLPKCKNCGTTFLRKNNAQRVCSINCRDVLREKRYQAELARIRSARVYVPVACKECGKSFLPNTHQRKYCSAACLKKKQRAVAKRKARALLRLARVESVNPVTVFQRDKWRCQLCGVKTPRRLRGSYEPDAPEMDHVVPLSLGGEHSYRNTQCACRSCNGKKSNTPLGQLRLFG